MASAAHVYGKRIVGAEAFTASEGERWLGHPAYIKDLGDLAFCEGINRFVFHRYALQPWTNPDYAPGISMGPGVSITNALRPGGSNPAPWHEYLARCQFLLQQGLFVADFCFLTPETSPHAFKSPVKSGIDRPGYNFDGCPPEVVLTRMSVKDGRLLLPDGMSYRLLVLPDVQTMTPQLLRKIKELVSAGATVVGAPPVKSPSLTGYPQCDAEVKALAAEMWGTNPPPARAHRQSLRQGPHLLGGPDPPRRSEPSRIAGSASQVDLAQGRHSRRQRTGGPALLPPHGGVGGRQRDYFRAGSDDRRQRFRVLHQRWSRRRW